MGLNEGLRKIHFDYCKQSLPFGKEITEELFMCSDTYEEVVQNHRLHIPNVQLVYGSCTIIKRLHFHLLYPSRWQEYYEVYS